MKAVWVWVEILPPAAEAQTERDDGDRLFGLPLAVTSFSVGPAAFSVQPLRGRITLPPRSGTAILSKEHAGRPHLAAPPQVADSCPSGVRSILAAGRGVARASACARTAIFSSNRNILGKALYLVGAKRKLAQVTAPASVAIIASRNSSVLARRAWTTLPSQTTAGRPPLRAALTGRIGEPHRAVALSSTGR